MNAGFNTMPITHRIDEFVFDCSYDSLAQANTLEPEMSALLTDKLLPVIDSVLNEFDQTGTVWRLDQVEIDLGDIASEDFYAELMSRVQEKLRERLRRLQDHHQPLDSVMTGIPPARRLNKMQTDLEILQDFLLTGRMPWHIDTVDRHAHENVLRQILQQQDAREAWITLLKRLTVAQRAVAIGRLVSQFSQRSLENVLTGIAPADARPLLDFLSIYQHALSEVDSRPAVQTERTRPVWEQLFKLMLESNPLPGNWTILLDRLIKTIVPRHAQASSPVLQSIRQAAIQFHEEGKISSAFHDALQTVNSLYSHHPQHRSMEQSVSLRHRDGSSDAAQSKATGLKRTKGNEEIKRETPVLPDRKKQTKQTEVAYEALQKAGLIDAGFASLLMGLAPVERRQRLRRLLQLPAIKPRLPQLPQAALLDIGYWLSPQAALLMECLLAHVDRLYQLPGTAGRTTRKYWKQRRWSVALDYLLRETDSPDAFDPAGFMRALAHGAHGESTEAPITLRAWYEALVQSEPYGVITLLLRTLIDETPGQSMQVEENAAPSGKLPEQNTLQQPLHKHLTAGNAIPGQQDPATLLKALASGQPEQLRQLYQELRDGRYDLTVAQLDAASLHRLIEKLLQIQSSTDGADWPVFLQAIEAQADRVNDQATYYRLILKDLLQEREIDLEAIAALARQSLGRIQNDEEDRGKQAAAEETKRAGETEGKAIAGQVIPEAATAPVVYPAGQSAKPVHTGHAALYLRITAVLRDARLIDRHPEVIVHEINPDELRQRLRAILRGMDMNGWIEKLPQASRMDIACLLSPQAALLNEYVLTQADTLQRSTATGTASNRQQWEQRLWEASLNYLLTETKSNITPAAYLQALARGVSDGTDSRATLRAWYEALEQRKTFGALHTVLKTFFSGKQEKDRVSVAQRTSVQPEAAAKAGELTDAGLPETPPETTALPGREKQTKQTEAADEVLHAQIAEVLQKAGLIDAGFASLLMGLPSIERRQRLRSLLQLPAVKPRLSQLPQEVLLNISYLLSPQAALLNEHVLAHVDTLQQSSVTDAGNSRKQWEERLWEASLNYLLAETGSGITPAAYLQALARGVSDEADARAALRVWYEALQQSKAFGTVHTVLQTFFSGTQEKIQASVAHRTSVQPEAATQAKKLEDIGLPETAISFDRKKQAKQTDAAYEELYARIAEALQKAGLIDAGFASRLMELAPVERRQRLRRLLQLPAVKPRLPQLPQAALLDIGYWLSPQAALLMECLLAHAGRLYQLPGTAGHITRKHWKRQRWSAALDYLLLPTDFLDAIDPAGFMRALAHGAHGEATGSSEAAITLRAWYEALVQSEPYGVITLLLRTLIDETPGQSMQVEENVAPSGKLPEQNTLQQPLHKHLTAGNAIPGQQDPATLLKALASGQPEQLRQLYQELRDGRYDLMDAQLDATGLHNLIEKLLQIQFSTDGTDWPVFLQAIEAQADRVNDQATYYRLILKGLLQEREIDLEAIAALARRPLGRIQEGEEDRGKEAVAEGTKRVGEAEGTEIAGQVTPEAAAVPVVYSTGQSTKLIHTGHAALYARITAALHKAGLIDQHPAATAAEVKPDEFRQRLRAILRGMDMNGWIEKLPQASRMDIAYLLSPQAALLNEHLLAQADTLQRSTATGTESNRQQWEQRLWEASLNYLLAETESEITPEAYLQALARGVSSDVEPRATLRAWYEVLEQSKTSAAIHTLLQTIAEASAVPLRTDEENKENLDSVRLVVEAEEDTAAAQEPPLLDWDALLHRAQSTDDVREEIYIENAGQVLAAPYLPRLFSMLKLVEDGAFIDRYSAERAAHLLQFMVNAQTRSPEYQLTLNKILCGVTTGIPICAEIGISAHEQETIEGLIRGMIQNWKTIGNTSISGLRETFLQRKGKLQLKEDGMWYLTVEPGVFDMLLDSLPWSYSVIKHSWMERAVHVTWR